MKITVEFKAKAKNNPENLRDLKEFLERNGGKGLKKIEFQHKKPKKGEMGEGLIQKLTGFVVGAGGPLTKLAEAFIKYVENMRSDIRLVNERGEEWVISAKLKKDDINQIIAAFTSHEQKILGVESTDSAKAKTVAAKSENAEKNQK